MNWGDFDPYVLPMVAGCPHDTVTHHVKLAAIEFCRRTGVWQENLDTLLADGYSTDFALPLDDQIELVQLIRVSVEDVDVPITNYATARDLEGSNESLCFTVNRKTLSVWPAPALDARIDVFCSIKPALTAFQFPDALFAHYAEDIGNGALSRLLLMPRADWADANLAEAFRARFNDAITSAALSVDRAYTQSPTRDVSMRFY